MNRRDFFMGISKRFAEVTYKKEWIYLGMIVVWLGITSWLLGYEEPASSFRLIPLLQFKLVFAGIVYLGRELLFPLYRNRKMLKTAFLVTFIVFASFQGQILTRPEWQYWLLRLGDGIGWSFFVALTFEPVIALAFHWLTMAEMSVYRYHGLWNRVKAELLALGFWLAFTEAVLYFYLVHFYMVDTVFYSYLAVGILWVAALGYYAIFASKAIRWVQAQVMLIDDFLESCIAIRPGQLPSTEEELSYLQWMLAIRQYIQGFKYPRIFVGNFLWYLIFSAFLLSLPYLFGVIIEV